MKKMIPVLSTLLCAALCAMLTACAVGGNGASQTTASAVVQTTAPATTQTESTTAAPETSVSAATTIEGSILTADYEAAGGSQDDGFSFGFGLVGCQSQWDESSLDQVMHGYHETLLAGESVYSSSDQGGEELYVIVPKYRGTIITLDHVNTNGDEDVVDQQVLTTEDTLFVRCNPSDIRSNVRITVRYNGEEWTFAPFISLKDGSVQKPDTARTMPEWENN